MPHVAKVSSRFSPYVSRFVIATVARILLDNAHHQITDMRSVQMVKETNLQVQLRESYK